MLVTPIAVRYYGYEELVNATLEIERKGLMVSREERRVSMEGFSKKSELNFCQGSHYGALIKDKDVMIGERGT